MSSIVNNLSADAVANLPRHVAVIMDGNGRWAKSRHLPRIEGHRRGADSAREIIRTAGRRGNLHLVFDFVLPALDGPTMPSTQNGKPIKAREAYERDYILKKLDENHGNVSQLRVAADSFADIQPVGIRKHDVQKDQVRSE